jgi:hypothetical protein
LASSTRSEESRTNMPSAAFANSHWKSSVIVERSARSDEGGHTQYRPLPTPLNGEVHRGPAVRRGWRDRCSHGRRAHADLGSRRLVSNPTA